MKFLPLLFLALLVALTGCENRNAGQRDPGPESPEDSQVAHPNVTSPEPSPTANPQL